MKAIQQVIVNLRISKIELRNEDSPDIVPYSHNRSIEKTVVPLGPEITQVRDTFLNILGVCARRLMSLNVLFTKDIGSLTKFMVIQSRDKFRQNPPDNFPRSRSGMTEGDFAICITLCHALELLLQHGIRGFYNFLAGKTDAIDGEPSHNRTRTELLKVPGFSQMMEELKSKFGQDCQVGSAVSHPKLFKLREIVVDHFQRAEKEGRPTRVMIFSQYRDSVHEIVALLEQHNPLIKAMSFVGHGSSSGGAKTKGFTQADQIRVIKEFSEGNYNTLVSTCVGEEGLDIGDVDMIICYDVHKSPVRLVQRCGRTGRKRDGRIVMLMTEGKEEHVFNQSMLQKKNLLKNIVGNAKLKEFLLAQEPRLIPRHLKPRCHEMPMQVTIQFPIPAAAAGGRSSKSSTSTSAVGSGSITSATRKSKTTKCFYLSDAEMEYYTRTFQTNQLVAVVPDPKLMSGGGSGGSGGQLTLNLDKWLPWQGSLQPYHSVAHSTLTKNYVNIVELIQSQQENWYDNYQKPVVAMDVEGVNEEPARQRCSPAREPSFDMGHDDMSPNRNVHSKSLAVSAPHSAIPRHGLYSPDFLDLFQSVVSIRIDPPDIPSPPPFCPTVSTDDNDKLPLPPPPFQTFHSVAPRPSGCPIDTRPTPLDRQISSSGSSPDRWQAKTNRTNTPIRQSPAARLGSRKSLVFGSDTSPAVRDEPDRHWPLDEADMMDVTVGPRTPPPLSDADASTFFLEASPILSQRPKRRAASVKRNTDWMSATTSTPAPANKRIKLDPPANTANDRGPRTLVRTQDVHPASNAEEKEPTLEEKAADETLLSATQFLDLLDKMPSDEAGDAAFASAAVPKKQPIIQANFELEVDFFDSSCSSLTPAAPLPAVISDPLPKQVTPNTTPVKAIKEPLLESPIFNFMGQTPSPSPVRPKADFSLELPFTPPESKETHRQKSLVKAEFSIDFPESWDDEDILPPSPPVAPIKSKLKLTNSFPKHSVSKPACAQPAVQPPVQPAAQPVVQPNPSSGFDFKSAWDEGFELSLSDIEEIEVMEKNAAHLVQTENPDRSRPPSFKCNPTAEKDTSAIRRELDDIFGPEEDQTNSFKSIELIEEKEKAKADTPPVFTIDSDDGMLEITPPKPSVASKSAHSALTSDEDSPLIRRKVNRLRNPLMTQSTPIVQRKKPNDPSAAKTTATRTIGRQLARKASCSFLDQEAELSLTDGSCSPDEDDTQNDFYENSFVDDVATQVVTDT